MIHKETQEHNMEWMLLDSLSEIQEDKDSHFIDHMIKIDIDDFYT